MAEIKQPKELKQPQSKEEITVGFINKFFRYQINLAKFNYQNDKSDAKKEALAAAKKEHKEWIDFVVETYGGKETDAKTAKIIKEFGKKYYPDLPKKAPVIKGKFK